MNKISEIPEQTPIAEKPTVEMPADPWRCGACGSLRVSCQVWVDSNTYEVQSMAEDKDDLWCDDCAEHTRQVRESELMSDTVEPWWNDGTTEEDREIITGLNPENFSPKDDARLSAMPATCGGTAGRTTRRSVSGGKLPLREEE